MKKRINLSDFKIQNNFIQLENEITLYESDILKDFINQFKYEDLQGYFNLLKEKKNDLKQYLDLHLFKDGNAYQGQDRDNIIDEVIQDHKIIKTKEYSLRINNFQHLCPPIKDFIKKIHKETQLAMSCNMYITPNSESNCFIYHTDPQVSLVAQLAGNKIWHFPLEEDGSFMYNLQRYNEKQEFQHEAIVEIQKGDLFAFGQNVIHRAYLKGDEVSVHLTFALIKMNHMDILMNLMDKLDPVLKDMNIMYNYDISKETIKHSLDVFISEFQKLQTDDFFKEIQTRKMRNEIELMKKGRFYKD